MQRKNFFVAIAIFVAFVQHVSCESTEGINLVESFDEIRILNAKETSESTSQLVEGIFQELSENTRALKSTYKAPEQQEEYKSKTNDVWIGGSLNAYEMNKKSKFALKAYKELMKTSKTVALSYSSDKIKVPYPFCPRAPTHKCEDYEKIRTFDGSCNNLEFTWWGMSETPFKRLLKSEYNDYVQEPRTRSVKKSTLPNPRTIAMEVHGAQKSMSEWSHFMTYFGQFIDHDITLTAQSTYSDGVPKYCKCGSYDPECFNIPIPYGDKVNYDQQCMSVVRSSSTFKDFDCSLGPREQLNTQTHWLDLSGLYGKNEKEAQSLRDEEDGLLKSAVGGDGEILPYIEDSTCKTNNQTYRREKCFMAGDSRAEDNVLLSSIHTIFLRDHNKLAGFLKDLTDWSSDKIYFNTRRILTAVYQNIVYSEFLPALLGDKLVKLYGLLPYENAFFEDYNDKLYPQILNEFSTAAFRYGHTFITGSMHDANPDYEFGQSKSISYYLFNNKYYKKHMNRAVVGSLRDWSYAPSAQTNEYVCNHLFENLYQSGSKRWSLPALNIQRGRDHGLPSYNKYRKLCGLNEAYKFEELYNIPNDIIRKLKKLYESPADIDLFTGLFSEYPLEGGMLGATAGCIVAKTFRDLKYADRFFYERKSSVGFNEDQLNSIKNVTMSRVLCGTIGVEKIQKFAFFVPNKQWNPVVECDTIPGIDLKLFIKPEDSIDIEDSIADA